MIKGADQSIELWRRAMNKTIDALHPTIHPTFIIKNKYCA